jgi:hypothetical protein
LPNITFSKKNAVTILLQELYFLILSNYMIVINPQQIKKIASEIDCGFTCYIHKQNGEMIFLPDPMRYLDMDTEAWSEDMDKVDDHLSDYLQIDPLESSESFKIMEHFAESLDETNPLKDRLYYALNKRKPFSEFKFVIDNSGEFRQQWFDFKNQQLIDWVQDSIERFNRFGE